MVGLHQKWILLSAIWTLWFLKLLQSQVILDSPCPADWVRFRDTCYLFVRSPQLTWPEAYSHCRQYLADLLAVSDPDEHTFIADHLHLRDPTVSTWYTSGFDAQTTGDWLWVTSSPLASDKRIGNDDPTWINHGAPMSDVLKYMDLALTVSSPLIGRALAYNLSSSSKTWGWLPVTPDRSRPFICELPQHLVEDIPFHERQLDYGLLVDDPDKLPAGPIFVEEPVDAVYDTTAKTIQNWVTIRCGATGFPPPDYSWYRIHYENGQELHYLADPLLDANFTQTDGALTIYNPESFRNRGEYYCMATNQYGSAVSRRVALRFGYVGDFALRREAMQLVLFNGGAVPCDAPTHYPPVSYAWARDVFPNFVEENQRIFVSKDGNLYFSHVESSDEGIYQCIVKSTIAELGKTGPFFQINVRREHSMGQLKIWSSFPKVFPVAPVAADNISLECFASGYPPPRYEWRRLEAETLPSGAHTRKHGRVLNIPNVQIGDSGQYECRASSSQGSVAASITVDIKVRPVFLVPLKSQLADAGSDVTWTCAAFGKPPVLHRWYKNGRLLDYTNRSMDLDDIHRHQIDGNRLTIRQVQDFRDNGMVQCEARSILGSAFSTAELRIVSFPPTFRKRPLDSFHYAAVGGNVTLYCQPEAAPKPSIQWFFDNVLLVPSPRHKILGSGDLLITLVHPLDQGVYACDATNALGTDRSAGFLKVLRGPVMIEVPVSQQVPVGGSTIMRCTAEADPLLDVAYTWRLNDVSVVLQDNDKFYAGWKARRGYLFIRQASYSEAGDYTCVVETPIVTLSYTARLDVIGPPSPPTGLQVIPLGIRSNALVLRWTDSFLLGLETAFYSLETSSNHTAVWFTLFDKFLPSRVLLPNRKEVDIIDKLQPWNSYRFRIRAANLYGWSEPSAPSPAFEIYPTPPGRPPFGISGGGGKPGHLVVIWQRVPPHEQSGPGIGYRVLFRPSGSTDGFREEIVSGDKQRTSFAVGDQYVYEPFEVQVQAFNSLGNGPISAIHIVHSADKPPTVAPVNVQGIPFNATAINVTWTYPSTTQPRDVGGRLMGHRVKYWRRGWTEEEAWTVLFPYTEQFALIKGLEPFTEYMITVMAVNTAGHGPQSEIAHARTFRSEPKEFPMGVRVWVRDWNSVGVDWRGIMTTPQEEPVRGYKIRYWRQGEHVKEALDLMLPLEYLNGKFATVLGGLVPEESYNLRVLAYSQGGDGRMSSPVWQFRMAISGELRVGTSRVFCCWMLLVCLALLTSE